MLIPLKGTYWKSLSFEKINTYPLFQNNVLYPIGIYTFLSNINNTHWDRKIALHFLCKAFFSKKSELIKKFLN
jgi:hypothetical protein